MIYKTEACLVSDLRSYVPQLWGELATSRVEVRCHDQARMDLLVWTPSTLIGIEAKLSHWNRVLAQAYLHRYCVDQVFVAFPAERITEARRLEASRFGIGVIAVARDSADIVQEASPLRTGRRIRQMLADSVSNFSTA